MPCPFFTIGHSTRTVVDFVDLLSRAEIRFVVDVRKVPRSRVNPQFNSEEIASALCAIAIGYEHVPSLGGLRGLNREVPANVNAFWENRRFHNYADYAMSAEFQSGLDRLRELGYQMRCAVMCSEAVWWRCHRRIITDYLIAAGEAVFHVLGPNQIVPAHITSAAEGQSDGTLAYPAT